MRIVRIGKVKRERFSLTNTNENRSQEPAKIMPETVKIE